MLIQSSFEIRQLFGFFLNVRLQFMNLFFLLLQLMFFWFDLLLCLSYFFLNILHLILSFGFLFIKVSNIFLKLKDWLIQRFDKYSCFCHFLYHLFLQKSDFLQLLFSTSFLLLFLFYLCTYILNLFWFSFDFLGFWVDLLLG